MSDSRCPYNDCQEYTKTAMEGPNLYLTYSFPPINPHCDLKLQNTQGKNPLWAMVSISIPKPSATGLIIWKIKTYVYKYTKEESESLWVELQLTCNLEKV
jgi:hypothetical protein